jgi:hypothetical protein
LQGALLAAAALNSSRTLWPTKAAGTDKLTAVEPPLGMNEACPWRIDLHIERSRLMRHFPH